MKKTKKIKISKIKSTQEKKKIMIVGIALISLVCVGLACFSFFKNDEKNPIDKPVNEEIEKPPIKEEIKKLKIVDEDSTSRPYAIMINNISVARPLQSGLQDAYIIYELIAEGGITRYMALFKDQTTERIGSIRSARHYYLDYAMENDAIYVHHGQSPQALSDFSTLKNFDRIEVNERTTGWRDKSLGVSTEHTLFTSIDKLANGVGKKRTTTNKDLLLKYSVDELDMANKNGATKATNVSITYSSNTTTNYTFDEANGYYLRSVNNKAHTDFVTKKQYHFKNIITYQVKNSTIVGGGKGRQELDNIGTGTGYYISGGYSIPIKWQKTSRESQTKYYTMDNEELIVNDGNTFIQIQPTNQNLTIS